MCITHSFKPRNRRKIKGKTEILGGGQPPFFRCIILWKKCGLVENLSARLGAPFLNKKENFCKNISYPPIHNDLYTCG